MGWLKFRGRKTIPIGPVRLHFSQAGYTGWGLKVGRWTWSARTGRHSVNTPGFGSLHFGSWPRRGERVVPVLEVPRRHARRRPGRRLDPVVLAEGGDPYVIESGGRYYLADGHHRAAAAVARGDRTITVRVKRAGDR